MPGMNRVFHDLGLLAPHDPDQVSGFLVVIAIVGTGVLLHRRAVAVRLRPAGQRHQPVGGAGRRRLLAQDDPHHDAHLGRAGRAGRPALPARPGLQLLQRVPAANLGFNGIAVALLGRNKPIGIAFAALLWGFLERSAQILDLNNIPQEIYVLMQGSIVLAVVVAYEIVRRAKVRRAEREVAREVPEALGGAVEVTA